MVLIQRAVKNYGRQRQNRMEKGILLKCWDKLRKIMRWGCLNLSLLKMLKEKFLYLGCSFIQLILIRYLQCARQQSKLWGHIVQMTATEVIINVKYMKKCCKGKKSYKKLDASFSCVLYMTKDKIGWTFENKSRSSNILLLTPFIRLDNPRLYFWREIKHHFLNEVFVSLLHIKSAALNEVNYATLLWHTKKTQ